MPFRCSPKLSYSPAGVKPRRITRSRPGNSSPLPRRTCWRDSIGGPGPRRRSGAGGVTRGARTDKDNDILTKKNRILLILHPDPFWGLWEGGVRQRFPVLILVAGWAVFSLCRPAAVNGQTTGGHRRPRLGALRRGALWRARRGQAPQPSGEPL